jgi:hypothetical protein
MSEPKRTPTVGYGSNGRWQGLNIDAMVRDVVEGLCPGCKQQLFREVLLTYNHREPQQWGCCHCCSRAWLFSSAAGLKATACIEHTNWECDHPLPGGTWTPAQHAAVAPAVRRPADYTNAVHG